MGPPTVTQRIDSIEEKLTDLEESMKGLVMQAVEKAMDAMRHSLTAVLMEGQGVAATKLGADFESLAERLEGRVNRSCEYHESLINTMRNEQLKFHNEIKSSITGLQSIPTAPPEKGEGSINRGESLFGNFDSTLGRFGDGTRGFVGREGSGVGTYGGGSGQGPGLGN